MTTEQLVLPLLDIPDEPARPSFARRVPAGPTRLLRDLIRGGLDTAALPIAAALVLELDRRGVER
jgi:hypothetical protein